MRTKILLGACSLLLLLAMQTPLGAQSFTGQIVGTVSDQSAAVLPGVSIIVTNTETNANREVITNEAGNITVPGLAAGQYKVEAQLPGFRSEIRTGVLLQVNQTVRMNFQMSVGDLSQTVEVTGTASLVQSDSAALGQVIDRAQI